MISLKKIKQSPSMCGPASLVSLLDFYGIQKDESELAALCNSTLEHGTPPANIVAALKQLGFTVMAKENSSWADLTTLTGQGVPVMVNWWSEFELPADGHYSVAFRVTSDLIHLMDPEIGDDRIMTKDVFLRNWYDFIGEEKTPITRWSLHVKKF